MASDHFLQAQDDTFHVNTTNIVPSISCHDSTLKLVHHQTSRMIYILLFADYYTYHSGSRVLPHFAKPFPNKQVILASYHSVSKILVEEMQHIVSRIFGIH